MKKKKGLYVDKTAIMSKMREAFSSVLPIAVIVVLLCSTIIPVENGKMLSFLLGALLTIVGIGLFTLGADTAMTPIGEYVGKTIINTKRLWIILPVFFFVGIFVTISEPDLAVLATQLSDSIDKWLLLIAVGVGVGVFLVIAILRIVLKIKFSYLIVILYVAVFTLSFFVPKELVPLSFDSGGVTTGPMSVPFIIAIGTGVSLLRSDKGAENDSFGLTALCSIGPILSVMILGIILKPHLSITNVEIIVPEDSRGLVVSYLSKSPEYFKEVGLALLPMVAFFFITLLFGAKVGRNGIIKIVVGVVYTYIGLVLFLTGVNCGFYPMGMLIGNNLVSGYGALIIPVGIVLGYFVVAAEPAVHVLTTQVYEITSGMIPKKALRGSLMIGTAVSVGLAMTRIVLGINIFYFLIPGYLIALVLVFIVPEMFTAIAFDSGGVASGAMTSGFLLSLALGVCDAVGGNVATEGFGLVAFVAMTPLITIQVLGLIYKIKVGRIKKSKSEDKPTVESILD